MAVSFKGKSIAAIFFDIDGTLYDSFAMKKKMLKKIVWSALKGSFSWKDHRTLLAYRHIHRELQSEPPVKRKMTLADFHIQATAARLGLKSSEVDDVISKWMRREPLSILRACRQEGLLSLLNDLQEVSELGVFSDYPVEDKLEALGVESYFKWKLSSHDDESNGYKPQGNGFERLCHLTGLRPGEILYIGDEVNADILGAKTHGLNAILVNRRSRCDEVTRVRHLNELKDLLLL